MNKKDILEEKIIRLKIINKSLIKENELLHNSVDSKENIIIENENKIINLNDQIVDLNNKLNNIYNKKLYKIYIKINKIKKRLI